MKFKYYKYALVILIALTFLVLGLYISLKGVKEDASLYDLKFAAMTYNQFFLYLLKTGEIICTDKVVFILKYPNQSIPITSEKICDKWNS